jgi:hypothetical protein
MARDDSSLSLILEVSKIESDESDDEGVGQDSLGMEGKSWGDAEGDFG